MSLEFEAEARTAKTPKLKIPPVKPSPLPLTTEPALPEPKALYPKTLSFFCLSARGCNVVPVKGGA